MATTTKTMTTKNTLPAYLGLAALVVIGIAAWIYQLVQGMSVIGVGQSIVWGVYIATFFFLAGTAGGLVILAALADLHIIPDLQSARRNLLIGALALFVASGFMILMDLGRPFRVLNMILSANLTSPFMWDFASLALAVVVTAVYLYLAPKGRWLPVLAGIVAGVVIAVEGWILSMSAGSSLWHGGIMPATFLVEGLITASAIALIARPDGKSADWLRRALLVFLPILVLLNLFEIASVLYAGEPDTRAAVNLMMANPLFWANLLIGIVLPYVLLLWKGADRNISVLSAILVLLAVFVVKYLLLVSGQALPYMQSQAAYLPSVVEISGVVGIAGLAGLLYLLGVNLLGPKPAR